MRHQNPSPKTGNSRRHHDGDSNVQSDASTMRNSLSYNGRFSSVASLQSARHIKRKEAFDDETQMMESTTADENVTFFTSTTDYLQDGMDAKSRNLDASFDSADSPASRGKDPTPTIGSLSLFSQNSSKRLDVGINTREKKRLQEREWERDRQRKETAEPKRNLHFTSKLIGIGPDDYKSETFSDDDSNSFTDCTGPQSSRQLGTGLDAPATGRSGYELESCSLKALDKLRYKTARPSVQKIPKQQSFFLNKKKHSKVKQDSCTMDEMNHRQPTTISKILSGKGGGCREGDGQRIRVFQNSINTFTADKVDQDANSETSFMAESVTKIKMTKMEKIKQLQAKNDRYKEEYKKTYLEKKEFKKKYEDKKMEVASLTTEIESYMRETALLKKQLMHLMREADKSKVNAHQDLAMVGKLQDELKQTRADLKEALGRIAERKMESSELKEIMKQKDHQIETLTLEVSRQIEAVQKLQAQISVQDISSTVSSQPQGEESTENATPIERLRKENDGLKEELAMTLDRAAEMVKNREAAIEILRKENHELKELMDIRDQDDSRTTTSEKIQCREVAIEQLKTELAGLQEMLENSMEEKERLKQTISDREREVKKVKLDIDSLKKMVKRAEKEAHKSRQEIESRDGKIHSLQLEIQHLEKQGQEAKQQVDDISNAIGERDLEIRQLMDEIDCLKENRDGSSVALGKAQQFLETKEKEMKGLYRENENLKSELLQQREQLDERRKRVVIELEEAKIREKELENALQESADKVKQREDAIEDLLKDVEKLRENCDTKESHVSQELSKQEQNILSIMKDMEFLRRQLTDKGHELEHARTMVKEREVAIEDLLRDIEKLKEEGVNLERKGNDQTKRLKREIDNQNDEIDKLRGELEDLTNRLQQVQCDLRSKSEILQEREDSIEELLEDMDELKRQCEMDLQQKQGFLMSDGYEKDALVHELKLAHDTAQDKEAKLQHLFRENEELKQSLEALQTANENLDMDDKDYLSEEGDTKSYLIAQHEVLEEEIQQLNDQVSELQEELEDVHRQNSILNEEVEEWLQRGGNMELEIQRLKNEVEAWEDRAEQLKGFVVKRKEGSDDNASNADGGDQQAMHLAKAMSERNRKAAADGKGVWGLFFNQSEEGEELTEDQRRIRELECIKDAQAEELQKAKSDLVRLTAASKDEDYKKKKRISDLEEANEGYKAKVDLLLRRLAEVQGVPYDIAEEKKANDDNSIFPQNLL